MDRSSRKAKKPTTGTTEQAGTEKLTEEEKALRKEVDNVLQGELGKLLAEKQEEAESAAFQGEVQKGKATEKSKERKGGLALQNEVEKAQTKSKEETESESPQREVRKASAKRRSKAESEPSSSWDEAGKGRVREMSKQGTEEENTQEETEDTETQESRDSESPQAEAEESSEKVKWKQGSLSSKEEEGPSSAGSLWVKHKEKIREIGEKPLEELGPPGYFAKLTQRIMRDLPTFQKKLKASEVPEKYKRKNMHPRIAKLLSSELPSTQQMKTKHQLSLKDSRLTRILSQDLSEDEEEKDESKKPDLHSSSSKTVPFETSSEEKRKAEAAAEDSTQKGESLSSTVGSSVWNMGQKISHWKMAHQHGYHVGQLTQDKIYKQRLLKHERDTKISMPMPLQEVMEEEVFDILLETLFDYHKKLGSEHPLTIQMEQHVEHLHLQLQGRRVL
ncbi:Hypothetical predicted protein [Podarcis lilfordi]|uniref:Uncharacterized protein n=1 Tax=Podarcis lilfordi TaxID=74358 RepID=A0AA35LLQ2_9SAUR|nr:Hypothetical predicted protein [Podarcis lilfordi]